MPQNIIVKAMSIGVMLLDAAQPPVGTLATWNPNTQLAIWRMNGGEYG